LSVEEQEANWGEALERERTQILSHFALVGEEITGKRVQRQEFRDRLEVLHLELFALDLDREEVRAA
jgi:hypothetical protein